MTDIFFFSSRRRHTRFSRDWSSDVCSSDLSCRMENAAAAIEAAIEKVLKRGARTPDMQGKKRAVTTSRMGDLIAAETQKRSEERRVGKECRARRSLEPEKQKDHSHRQGNIR